MEGIHEAVEQIVHTYGTNDPFRLSQLLLIHLLPSRTPAGMWGILYRQDQGAFFGYDVDADASSQCLYVAHGIAHLVLHRDHDPLFIELDEPGPSAWEAEAREFAVWLLHGAQTVDRLGSQRMIP